jgi:hypothetical protein
MKKNVGKIDKIARIILGLVLMALGIFQFGALQGNLIGIVMIAGTVIMFLTSTIEWCPILSVLKISTKKE